MMKCLHGFSLSRLFVASLPLLVACGSGSSATLFSGTFQAAPGSTAGSSSASASGGSGGSTAVTAQPASGGATQLAAGGSSADTAVGGNTGSGAATSNNPSGGASSIALGGAPGAAGNASGTVAGASGASGPSNGVGGGASGTAGSLNGAFGGVSGVSGSSSGAFGGANGGSAASNGAAGGSSNQPSCPVEAPQDQSACTAVTPDSCYWKGVACSCFADDPGNGNPGRGAPSRSWSCVGTPDRCPDAIPMDGAPCRNLGGASCPYSAQDYCVCVQGQGRNNGGDLSWSCSSAATNDCPLLAPIPGSQPPRMLSCDMAKQCSYGDRACFCDTSDWHCE